MPFHNEKESKRIRARCQVSFEKSSKNYSHCENEPSQAKCIASPLPHHLVNWRMFLAGFPRGGPESTKFIRHGDPPLLGERAGWSVVWYNSITDWKFSAQFKVKMDSDVLLLSYLDKICLVLTGELWRALACLYCEARLYIARAVSLSQSTTLHSTGNNSVWTKEVGHSKTRGTVRALFFPAQIYCCTKVYISNILWRLKQCCGSGSGSGSGRIRNFLQDPDPE